MTTPNYPGQEPPYQPAGAEPPYPQASVPYPSQGPPVPYPPSLPPYQTAPPQPGHPAAPQPPPKRRRWLVPSLIGGGIALALCCGGSLIAAGSGDQDKTSGVVNPPAAADAAKTGAEPATPKTEAAAQPAPKTFRVGQAVRGGDFEFVVHGMKCGLAQVGDSFLNRKAQGTYCRADISAKNVTKSAHLFHADGTVTVQDATGREYQADGEANIYGNKDGAGFLNEVNPGNSVRAFVYFDIPKGTKLTTVTFDAGLFTFAEDAVVTL